MFPCSLLQPSPKMLFRTKTWPGFHLLLLFSASVFDIYCSLADDSIYRGKSLSGNQTLVSKQGKFELGFFTPGNSHNYYIGIWYKKLPNQTIVWVANREKPILNTSLSEIKISGDGNLALLDQSKLQIWSSNLTLSGTNSTVAVLLDSGNLVLRDSSNISKVVWQSFDHPTDTWMPGGYLGLNKITGEYQRLTSWKNSEDPSPGPYTETIDPSGINQLLLLWNGTQSYWQSGAWNGKYYSLVPEMPLNSVFFFHLLEDDNQRRFTYTVAGDSWVTRFVVDVFGQSKQWSWFEGAEQWTLHWSRPQTLCEIVHLCGAFGICDPTGTQLCSCPLGFEPSSPSDWQVNDHRGGCARKTNLYCFDNSFINSQEDKFLLMQNMGLPQNSQSSVVENAEQCELNCLKNCSCTAYAYNNGCSIWIGELRNLQQLSGGTFGAGDLYIRLAASELPSSNHKNKSAGKVILLIVPAALAILCISSWLIWICQKKQLNKRLEANGGSLIQFRYTDLRRITKNFTEMLGRGSFGPVYKGVLPNKTVVAVKKLEGLRHGEKQFRAEVSTLGMIHNVNLVRLRGFCCEGFERLLVYDYMQNGSLNTHLFHDKSTVLDWRQRYNIILGVARGLAYLHESCRECIIHCDVKPENILLDEQLCAKVADFGMAKLIGRDMSRVLTTLRGTIGYLAPEWISGVPITTKVDVYGFGMMVLEVISGRRNTNRSRVHGNVGFFPVWAAGKINEGEVLGVLDERLGGNADMEELSRACRVACWCIQDHEADRPSMGQVVHALEGILEVSVPPVPMSLQNLIEDHDASLYSLNFVSV